MEEASAFEGQRVKLSGLASRPELNGQVGTAGAIDAGSGRWPVRLASGQVVSVQAANLEVMPPPEFEGTMECTPIITDQMQQLKRFADKELGRTVAIREVPAGFNLQPPFPADVVVPNLRDGALLEMSALIRRAAEAPVDLMALHAYASGLAQVGLHEGYGLMMLEGGANSVVRALLGIAEDWADPENEHSVVINEKVAESVANALLGASKTDGVEHATLLLLIREVDLLKGLAALHDVAQGFYGNVRRGMPLELYRKVYNAVMLHVAGRNGAAIKVLREFLAPELIDALPAPQRLLFELEAKGPRGAGIVGFE